MIVRFPKNKVAVFLADRFAQRLNDLVRDLEDEFDDLLQEQFVAGYRQGFEEGAHEIHPSQENDHGTR